MGDTVDKVRGFEVAINLPKGKGLEWENAILPTRSTAKSAGYDFFVAEEVVIPSIWRNLKGVINFGLQLLNIEVKEKGSEEFEPVKVHTGIKAYMMEDETLVLANRSSTPGNFGLVLSNGIGVVDADYYGNKKTDGEIMFGYYNVLPWDIKLKVGTKIGQGIFMKYLKADGDTAQGVREGGHGSTGIK